MSEATAPLPALEPPHDPDARIGQAIAVLAECVQVNHEAVVFMTELMAGRRTPVEAMMLVNRVADIGYDLRQLADLPAALRDAALIQAAGLTAPLLAEAEPEPGPVRRRARQKGRHASDRPLMRVLPSGALLPAAAAFRLRWPSLHAVLGHKVLLTAGAGSALAASAVVGMHANHALPFVTGTGAGSWHTPAAIAWDADPAPSPSSPLPTIYIGPGKPVGKHGKAAPAVTLTVAPPPQVPLPLPPDSSPSTDSSPSSPSSGDTWQGDGSGDGGGRSQDSGSTDTGWLSGNQDGGGWQDGGQGRHRGQDQGDGLWQQLGDLGGQYQGRHDGGSGDGGNGWQGSDGQQGGHGGGHGHGGGN